MNEKEEKEEDTGRHTTGEEKLTEKERIEGKRRAFWKGGNMSKAKKIETDKEEEGE